VGIEDPDARVAGRGFAMLREAGIDVLTGVEAETCRRVTLGHIRRVTSGRPFVRIKLAVAADGQVPAGYGGKPVWVTGAEARALAHLLRAEADAILVGIGTVLADDPMLDCRLPGMTLRSPRRIVLDSSLRLPVRSRLTTSASREPVTVFSAEDPGRARAVELSKAGVTVISVPRCDTEGLSLTAVLKRLAEEGVTRLLVEGGPRVARAFLDAGLADEIAVFRGRALAVGEPGLPAHARDGPYWLVAQDWVLAESRAIGQDRIDSYRRPI
jgi:diaminohydroxyphosphoribosylaminopyrimidine deaminase/5-amino-6-(5-phosphoribosylamino)uracil reductase